MDEQLTLTGDMALIPRLGPAQLEVLTALREHGNLSEDEAGAIVHHRRGKHDPDTRCRWCTQDGRHVLVSLRGHGLAKERRGLGWIDPTKTTVAKTVEGFPPGSIPHDQVARARRTDPPTSHTAAQSVGDLRESQLAVLLCFHQHGPMHDEKLQVLYEQQPQQSESGLRTRRRELFDKGLLRANGQTARTIYGRDSAIWELTNTGRIEAERHGRVSDALDAIGF